MLYKSILRPLLFQKDPESSHEMILRLLARLEFLSGALDKFYNVKDARLIVKVGPLTFANPVGLAAGFDKNALAPKTISVVRLWLHGGGRYYGASPAGQSQAAALPLAGG